MDDLWMEMIFVWEAHELYNITVDKKKSLNK